MNPSAREVQTDEVVDYEALAKETLDLAHILARDAKDAIAAQCAMAVASVGNGYALLAQSQMALFIAENRQVTQHGYF